MELLDQVVKAFAEHTGESEEKVREQLTKVYELRENYSANLSGLSATEGASIEEIIDPRSRKGYAEGLKENAQMLQEVVREIQVQNDPTGPAARSVDYPVYVCAKEMDDHAAHLAAHQDALNAFTVGMNTNLLRYGERLQSHMREHRDTIARLRVTMGGTGAARTRDKDNPQSFKPYGYGSDGESGPF